MSDLGQWYNNIPRFSRYWITGTLALSLLARFGILPMQYLFLHSDFVFRDLQLWRCVTALFVYPLNANTGFHFLINCFFISQYSAQVENQQFGRSPAGYLYMLLIIAFLSNVIGLLFGVYFLMDILVVSTTYVWCQLNKDVIVTFWFGIRFKAIYLPWVLSLIEFVFQGKIESLIGIFVGHFYYFFKFQYPQELGGSSFLETPSILKQYLPDLSGGFSGFGEPPASRTPQHPAAGNRIIGNTWGRGNQLGRN